jgi:uncharacterized protein YfaQ (DUF2300 family)
VPALKFARRTAAGLLLGALAAFAAGPAQATPTASAPVAAWLRDGRVESRLLAGADSANPEIDAGASAMKVPLGSLWKLFSYAWLADRHASEPDYVCAAPAKSAEDHYCCDPGGSIGRDAALARSCAPYFEPPRLGINKAEWRRYWSARGAPAWLADLDRVRPGTQVELAELLAALATIPPPARAEARRALLETGFSGYGSEAFTALGSGIRYKTYTWHRASEPGVSYGGAAGWLADGTPFWFGARGSSHSALAAWAGRLAATLPPPRYSLATATESSCVEVEFFARYKLNAVWPETPAAQTEGKIAQVSPGELNGRYRFEFSNGNWLSIRSAGGIFLNKARDGTPLVSGRFGINDYVARVIDREGSATHTQAARALAVAARSYLMQNARLQAGCWAIEDSSRMQRVSANQPSDAALAAAWFTDDLVLQGAPVQYHRDQPGADRLVWRDAVGQDAEGWEFDRILAAAYPKAVLASLSGSEDCSRLDDAEAWLAMAALRWRRELQNESGFEPVAGPVTVCALAEGRPYSDQQRARIYVRGWRSLDERVTLAHEYLHIALRFHPSGADEDHVERLARRLAGG